MDFVTGRNFFVRDNLPPFFSVAGVEDQGNVYWIFAGLDGRARLYDKALAPAGTFSGWGSDIAGIETRCGSGRQVLVTRPSDSIEPDSIQAFEIVNQQAVATSPPLELPGPVTALWQAEGKNAAVVVSRSLKTGRYAAFHLSISCGR
ncbi:MAG: hypothetical protein ACREUU_08855 [Gammaproteobacteria bacterium]